MRRPISPIVLTPVNAMPTSRAVGSQRLLRLGARLGVIEMSTWHLAPGDRSQILDVGDVSRLAHDPPAPTAGSTVSIELSTGRRNCTVTARYTYPGAYADVRLGVKNRPRGTTTFGAKRTLATVANSQSGRFWNTRLDEADTRNWILADTVNHRVSPWDSAMRCGALESQQDTAGRFRAKTIGVQ